MTFKNLLILNAVVFTAFGVGFVLIPTTLLSLYRIGTDPSAVLLAQAHGGVIVAIGLLTWLSREVADAAAHRAMQLLHDRLCHQHHHRYSIHGRGGYERSRLVCGNNLPGLDSRLCLFLLREAYGSRSSRLDYRSI